MEKKRGFRTLDDPEPIPSAAQAALPIAERLGELNANAYADQLYIHKPAYLSRLFINEDMRFEFARPIPNRWRRFWYWALLGWKWRRM